MTLCDQCLKPITGQYHYSEEKNDDKKFCCSKCMYEYYGFKCAECGKVLPGIAFEKDGKKFCGTTCQNKHSSKETNEQVSNFWQEYKGWIIGGIVIIVLLIILGIIFGNKKKK